MSGRRTLFIFRYGGRKLALAAAAIILIAVLINSIIFAQYGTNPLEGKCIIIDAGHGGVDGGTNDGSTFLEKDINLQIALKLKEELEANNAIVSMTRETDISLDSRNKASSSRQKRDLLERVYMFNSGKHDTFVSIHVNRSSKSSAVGPMVAYSKLLPQSLLLAQSLQNRLNSHAKSTMGGNAVHKPSKANFFILVNSRIPGVLVESGFISNSKEKALLMEENYRTKLAKAICEGMKDYYRSLDAFNKSHKDDTIPEDLDESIPFDITNEVRLVEK